MRLGIMFTNMDSFDPENNLILDEFIDILVDNNHLNIDFWEDSPFCNTYVGENLFDYTETSYQDGCSWRNISHLYLKNIIGQTIKDIYVEKANFDYVDENDIDMVERFANRFQSIRIILENGYSFVVTNDLDYMHIYQEKQE